MQEKFPKWQVKVMLRSKALLGTGVVLVLLTATVFFVSKSFQETTCRKTLERSFSSFLKGNDSFDRRSLSTEWHLLDLQTRSWLFEKASQNVYNECRDYPFLLNGKDNNGLDVQILGRASTPNHDVDIEIRY